MLNKNLIIQPPSFSLQYRQRIFYLCHAATLSDNLCSEVLKQIHPVPTFTERHYTPTLLKVAVLEPRNLALL